MKKFLRKALGLVTLATVVPVSITHDEIAGKTTYQSLLASLTVGRGKDGQVNVGLNLGEGILTGAVGEMVDARKEAALFADYDLTPVSVDGEPAEAEAPAVEEEPVAQELPAPEETSEVEGEYGALY